MGPRQETWDMEPDDRRLIVSIALIVIGYLHHIFLMLYERQFEAPYDVQLTFVGAVATAFMFVGLAGMVWFGCVKDLLRRRSEKKG